MAWLAVTLAWSAKLRATKLAEEKVSDEEMGCEGEATVLTKKLQKARKERPGQNAG